MKSLIISAFMGVWLFSLGHNQLIASPQIYHGRTICELDERSPDTSLIALLWSREVVFDLTKELIEASDIQDVIDKYIPSNSVGDIRSLSFSADDILRAATYKYLTNQADDLRSALDFAYVVNFQTKLLDFLNQSVGDTSPNNNMGFIEKSIVRDRIEGISRLGKLYYRHWEMTADVTSLDRAIDIFTRLRSFLHIHIDILPYRHSSNIKFTKIYKERLLPKSKEYFYWEYTGYLEIALAQKAVSQNDLKFLEKAIHNFEALSVPVEKEIDAVTQYIDGEEKVEYFSSLALEPATLSAYRYLLFEKPIRELFFQKMLLDYLRATLDNQFKKMSQIQRAIGQDLRNSGVRFSEGHNCDDLFSVELLIFQADILRAMRTSVVESEPEYSQLIHNELGVYSEAMRRIKYEVSPVLWFRALRGMKEVMKTIAQDDKTAKVRLEILENLYRGRQ
ncbi:hypothetical protein [Paremcibacter congregatus]|uniref:Uncharacterized protein n=1 Tax=Paremcibacter congregatus TaxID=2043170 RepID=A0A2G4YNZ3_9PROT|nr:hypothetical protein [Paremcibacter congregatus]PHZ84041.1 hypothetical protein CRD36_12620 [Paremcibacter congregatus]QDE25897.1 hypothetical protein FIV45_00690 [Paremcibacter congregatus]